MKNIESGNKGTVKGNSPIYKKGTVPLPKGIRTEIRTILQDTYFVIKKPEKFQESFSRFNQILNNLENTDYILNSDYVEAKSLATAAQEIMLEVTIKNQEDY